MVKKLLLIIGILAVTGGCACAEPFSISEALKTLPLQQGVVYSLKDSELSHVSSVVLAEKWGVGLEAGYIDNGKLFAGLSYKLVDAKDYVSLPVIKELSFRPTIGLGLDEIDTGDPKVDFIVGATILKIVW